MKQSPYTVVMRIRHQPILWGMAKIAVTTYDITFNGKPVGGLTGEIDPFNVKMIEESLNIAYQAGLLRKESL